MKKLIGIPLFLFVKQERWPKSPFCKPQSRLKLKKQRRMVTYMR